MVTCTSDLSILTQIPEDMLNKIFNKLIIYINDIVEEALVNDINEVEIDLYIGKLVLNFSNELIRYKFIPYDELKRSLHNTIINKQNLLENILDTSLCEKLKETYKEFI